MNKKSFHPRVYYMYKNATRCIRPGCATGCRSAHHTPAPPPPSSPPPSPPSLSSSPPHPSPWPAVLAGRSTGTLVSGALDMLNVKSEENVPL